MNLSEIVAPLLAWYDRNARILPWRDHPTPYRVWISEIMLQQTRVEAVKPYYDRFLQTLPTVEALANASEEVLLKLWEGLGYYNRVRNLQKAANIICSDFGGVLPSRFEDLLTLPGIGVYSAGAIASIAYGTPVPAVDGNVLRVISRIKESKENISSPTVISAMSEEIRQILPARVGDFNQSLMELGATVCLPNGDPKCALCPLASLCLAGRHGSWDHIPVKEKKQPRRIEQKTVLLLLSDGKIALEKRPESGLLAGMWQYPLLEGHLTKKQLSERFPDAQITSAPSAKHIFTHIEWRMRAYVIRGKERSDEYIWVTPAELKHTYALPSAFSAFTTLLSAEL